MNILLLYETYSSGTEAAAEIAATMLKEHGNSVTVKKAHTVTVDEMHAADLIILASPSWMVDSKDGQPHINYKELLTTCEGTVFGGKNFAVFGLGDGSYARFCGAVDRLEEFVKTHGGHLIVESLRIDSFFFEPEKNERILRDWVESLAKKIA